MSGVGTFSLGHFCLRRVSAEISDRSIKGFCESVICRSVLSAVGVGSIVSTASNLNRYPSPSQRFGLNQAGPLGFLGRTIGDVVASFGAKILIFLQKAFALLGTVVEPVGVLSDLKGVIKCLRKSGSGPLLASSHFPPAATRSANRRCLARVPAPSAAGLSVIQSPALQSAQVSTFTAKAIPTPADPSGSARREKHFSLNRRSSGESLVTVFYFGPGGLGRTMGQRERYV